MQDFEDNRRMLAPRKRPYIQRVRNSSLVERSCAENVRLKHDTEAEEMSEDIGRGSIGYCEAVPGGAVGVSKKNIRNE